MYVVHDPKHLETVQELEGDKIVLQNKLDRAYRLAKYLNSQLRWIESQVLRYEVNRMGRRIECNEPISEDLSALLREISK